MSKIVSPSPPKGVVLNPGKVLQTIEIQTDPGDIVVATCIVYVRGGAKGAHLWCKPMDTTARQECCDLIRQAAEDGVKAGAA